MDGVPNQIREFLFQDVEGRVRDRFRLRLALGLFGLRQRFPIHFLVDVQRNGVDLHRHGRDHVRRLPLEDEGVQRVDVDGSVAHDVGGEELAGAFPFLVEGLDRRVGDAGEFPDDALHLLQFDPEAPDLHLHVLAADELDVAVGPPADDVAGAVHVPVGGIVRERIVQEHLGRLVRPSQVADAHLPSRDEQFAGRADGQALSALADDVGADAGQGLADGHVGHLLADVLAEDVSRRFRGTIGVDEPVFGRGEAGELLATGVEDLERLVVREVQGELGGHLGGHHHVRDSVLPE